MTTVAYYWWIIRMLCFYIRCENNKTINTKFTLRNFITVVDYLHCPLEHMYYCFMRWRQIIKLWIKGCEIYMQIDYTNFTPQDCRQCVEPKIIMLIPNRISGNIFQCCKVRDYIGASLTIKSNPITGLDRPWGFQECEPPKFQDSRQMKVVSLSSLAAAAFTRQEIFLYSFLLEAELTPEP
jgi:hypothetical protein